MEVLFVFASIFVVVALVKCIYDTMEKSETPEPYVPTLEDTLISLIGLFKGHLHKFTIYSDKIVIYCFKNSPNDDVSDFNEIKVRYCDLGFKSISDDDCSALQDSIKSALNLE